MAVDLAELGISVRSDGVVVANKELRKMERQAGKTEKATDRLIRKTEQMGRSMQRVGRTMSMSITAPLLAIAGASIKMGADFDSSLTRMNTLVGVSREEIEMFRREILRLAPSLGKQPQEMADALFAVTSAGARGAEAMEILEASSKASAIGLGDTRDIALAAGAAVTAYGRETLSASEAVDTMVGIVEQGNLEASALAGRLGNVISIAKNTGVTFRDAGAFIAAFTRQGVSAEQAITGLRGTLAMLAREPTAEAEKALGELGMTMEGLRRSVVEDGFIVAFQEMVNRADEAGVSMARIIPEVEALAGSMAVFQSEGESAADIAEKIGMAVGTLEERLQAAEELDPALAIAKMKAELSTLFIEISTNTLPAFLELVGVLRDASKWFRDLSPEAQRLAVQFAAVAAAIGPALIVMGAITRASGELLKVGVKLRPMLTGLAVGLGSVGLAAAAAAIELERKLTPGMEEVGRGAQIFNVVTRAAIILRETFGALADAAKAMGEIVVSSFQAIVGPATAVITGIADAFMALINRDFEGAKKALKGIGSDMVQEFTDSMSGMAGAFDELGESVTERARTAVDEVTALQNSLTATGESAAQSTEGMGLFSDSIQILLDRARAYMQAMGEQAGGTDEAREASADWRRELDELEAQLAGPMAQANMEFAQRIEDINKRFADGEGDIKQWARAITLARMALEHARNDARSQGVFGVDFGSTDAALDALDAIADKMREMQDLEFDFENLIDSFHPLAQEMRRLGDAIDVVNENIEKGNIGQMEAMFVKSGAAANAMFGAMMSGVNRTSKEYENLQKAQQIVNVALGIAAILQQGMGDPYTAIPRMIAMAAMVASLGVNTGRLSGGGIAEQRQDTQGTGTVLGDAEAKSESIVNATEITADATSTLVGINRGMLKALQQLQSGIAGASGMLARGARTTEFGDLPGFVDNPFKSIFEGIHNFIFDPLGLFGDLFGGIFDFLGEFDIIGKFLGGSSKVVDQGIQIVGGTIGDLIDDVMVRAFQEVRYKKWKFGSTKRKTEFEDLDEGIADQFSLIFEAIADSVFEGALALGLAEEDIRAAMETFVIETQRISLMDLTAEEQQAELEAVFGAIFDGLAGHVVPFIGQFQRVGEGLGETLARVASSVQVVEEAIRRLGFQAERTGAEQFAQLSVALVEAAGGLDEFIEGMSSFIQHFAPEAHQLSIIGQSLASAFDQVGLSLPATREELWNLMQTLDANTEAGREQIATLLELADMADAYYSALEDATRDYAQAVQGLEEALVLDGLSDFQREMVGIQRELMQTIDAMNSAARAAGLQGAREEDLARAHELAAIRAQQAIARLESQAEEWVGELFGTSLSEITAQVNEAQAAFESLQSQLQQLSDFADSLLIGQFSPLPSGERLAEAMAQLEAASAAGDVSGVQSIAQTVLQIARDRFASGQQFTDIFNQVQDIIRGTDPADSIQGVSIISAPGLAPLLRQQSQLEQEAEDRREQLLANDIAQAVADLAMATGDSFEDVATRLGFDLQDLGDVLGLDERELADFIESLQVDTGDIATHLETLGDRIVAAILEGRDIQDAIDDRSVDSRTGGLAGDPIDERDIDSRFGGQAGERDVESITDSQGETTRAVEDASRDIRGSMETPAERAERMALLRRIAEAQEARSGGRNVRTRSAA